MYRLCRIYLTEHSWVADTVAQEATTALLPLHIVLICPAEYFFVANAEIFDWIGVFWGEENMVIYTAQDREMGGNNLSVGWLPPLPNAVAMCGVGARCIWALVKLNSVMFDTNVNMDNVVESFGYTYGSETCVLGSFLGTKCPNYTLNLFIT